MEELEDKITKASKSANARFKRKKIRSMKRQADKITEKLAESEEALKLLEPRVSKDPISGSPLNLGEIHYHKENKTNVGKQIEFSAESNQFDKKIKSGNK